MNNYQFNSMSTMVRISITHELFANDLMPVYKLFALTEDTCSRFKEDSELMRLNRQIGKEIGVSSTMFSILKNALAFFRETNGIFNPGILGALENSGYNKSIEYIKDQDIERANISLPAPEFALPYELDERNQTVFLHTKIDLGGIAKGWVIDQAAELLTAYGSGFINVGGDIRVFGTLPRALNIGIEDPFDPKSMIDGIQISRGAVATSTSLKRKWKINGEHNHHLIDIHTGAPSKSGIVSATVTAPTAMEADVWAKVTLLLGEEQGKAWISRKGEKGVLISRTKEIWKGGKDHADA